MPQPKGTATPCALAPGGATPSAAAQPRRAALAGRLRARGPASPSAPPA